MKTVLCLLLVVVIRNLFVSAQTTNEMVPQCSPRFSSANMFQSLPDQPSYLEPGTIEGRQVIAPEMKFNCHGRITEWTALTLFSPLFTILRHRIHFQVWRPSQEVNGKYELVGSNKMAFDNPQGPEVDMLNNTTLSYFNITGAKVEESDRIQFQPGDCLGWFMPNLFPNPPLNPVLLNLTDNPTATTTVDLFSTKATRDLCTMYTCSETVSMHQSVIPYVRPEYEVLEAAMPTSNNVSCVPQELPPSCTVITPTTLLPITSPTTRPMPTTDSNMTLYIIAGVVPGVFLVIFLVSIGGVLMCLGCRRWRRYLKRQYNTNPTYASPDDFIRLNQPPSKGEQDLARNGTFFRNASPENNLVMSFSNVEVGNDEDMFDGQNYATTYQTNGECHVYQELCKQPDADVPPPLPHRLSTVSQGSLRAKKNSAPRFSIHSITQFPYTMPNTPAPSFPYLEAVPITQTNGRPRTPEDSPPSSASVVSAGELTMRKLFHALEDEGFRVPTAEERAVYKDSSVEDIYSKLHRPHSDSRSRDSREATFFEPSEIFWEPSYSSSELFNQLAQRKYREIKRSHIRVCESLGGGHFSTVHKGIWEVPGGNIEVAVKTLKTKALETDKVKFLQEAAIMGQFLHPNVAKLQGVVTIGEPVMIVLELMPKGDLKNFLRSWRAQPKPADLPNLFLRFCREIAYGMNYLSNKGYVHRDLAARNILLTEDLTCKIGDFGMARDLDVDNIYQSQGGKIPLKWTAPEGLKHRQYSTASDVWSYGMLLFEIWTLGRKPYEGTSTDELMNLMNSFHCQPPPPGCPREIYRLMIQCWHPVPSERSRFTEICAYLNSTNEVLLNWSSADRAVCPRATELGAPLSEGINLYLDLQYMYSLPQSSVGSTASITAV